MSRHTLRVNGRVHEVDADANDSLLSIIRNDLGLTGSKYGCGEGHCGACTVLIDGQPARSCVTPVSAAAGKPVTTIEAIADGDRLHPVQEAFLEMGALQCGYCTPGMVVEAVALLRRKADPSEAEIARALEGHVCRCCTYPRIVRAVREAARPASGKAT
jgi:aerobic-type carbon monoxide dehydrogenase small subunit (CoxS/CutS family)